jgi:plasmid stabilization system protein ParE
MVKPKRKIVWDKIAASNLKDIYKYVKTESPAAALKIKSEIFSVIKKIPSHPEMFAVDKLKINNDGSYRAFFIYSYRIVYKITDERIFILRIRHTSREPETY